jgi:cytochrome c oxidase cbb3-type subunit 2
MTVKTFFFGLSASFGLPWLIMLVIPFGTMRSMEAPRYDEVDDERTDLYQPKRSGRIKNGSLVYAQEGCAMCHSQVTRPSYAGQDVFREGQGGFRSHPDRGDTRRITNAWDFASEARAHIGESRIGPDLGNFGNRLDALEKSENIKTAQALGIKIEKEDKSMMTDQEIIDAIVAVGDKAFNKELYVYKHLYNPRKEGLNDKGQENEWSLCQSNPQFFTKIGNFGQGASNAVAIKCEKQVVPTDDCLAIVNYLMSLKKDGSVPFAMQYSKDKKKSGK